MSSTPASGDKPAALPSGYRDYSLGMGLDELKKALASDELLTFRGDRDVSLLPQNEQVLIETTGLSFIRRAFFQLYEGKLFIMAFSLDPERIDYYSVYSAMVAKYGDPSTLSPKEAIWVSDEARVSIERPLTVKYIDMKVFKKLQDESLVKESRGAVLRKEFLNDF